ncbi:DUF3037 domain-containing protein [Paucibacter sp. M5-1]|uniref:DUF3037 domain-containing protein n=1 Tax=Paucibacter sp. M5-1 TaxID=3015998 RepID=UPI0022B902B6|nr:DUF3037 domain-containing protein [Paucibacter sp. M5-1]MCZ7880462.1 DUF3037 domain-containing protein [Paucibacter sp. M5-1]
MPSPCTYDYAIVRVVPNVEREEFVNAGVIVCCLSRGFLKARIELDEARLRLLSPDADIALIRTALNAIPTICAGGKQAGAIGQLSPRQRFDWLVAPRSTSIQTSVAHAGRTEDPEVALERLLDRMVRVPSSAADARKKFPSGQEIKFLDPNHG